MRAICEALILEDDPAQLAALEAATRELFLVPIGARTPDRALRVLRRHEQPVLAVIDALVARVRRMLGVRFGDLAVRRG